MMTPLIHLEQIFDSLTTAVLVFDTAGHCVYANESIQSLLNRGDRWLIGSSLEVIFEAEQVVIDECRAILENPRQITLREVEIPLPHWQRSLLVDLIITPVSMAQGSGLILELLDRKEFNKLSQDSHKTARFKAATRIVRGLCHEIKNPLGGIRGAAQLLNMEAQDRSTQEFTTVIMQEVDRLSELLDRMSSGAKTDKRVKTDIHQLLMDMTNLLKAEYGDAVEFNYDFDTSLPLLAVNPDQLKQALLNLIKNAVQWSLLGAEKSTSKARSKNPQVSLKTRAAYPDLMRSLMPEQGVRIQIQDSGPGVDDALLDQLFLPMVTRREGGTGLGLVISQEIIHSHGGFIELDEEGHKGASFSLYLPFSAREHEA